MMTNAGKLFWGTVATFAVAVAVVACDTEADKRKFAENEQIIAKANEGKVPENFMDGPKVVSQASALEQATPPPPEPESRWNYSTQEDPMTGKVARSAVIASTNTLNFGFPYGGEQHGLLAIRKHPSHGNDVILQIERGQILCHSYANDCPIKIRFDDGKAFTVSGNNAADNSTEVVFLPGFKSLTAKIAKAQVMRVQFNAYQQGAPVLTFDVAGFDPKKMQ